MKKIRAIGTLPNLNEIYSTERVPLDYGGGSLEAAVDQYEDGNAFVQDGGGLEAAVDQYKGDDFVRDGGNDLEIATDRYMGDDLVFVRDNGRDWTTESKEHEITTNEPSDITNAGDSFDNNETVKTKKNKMISMLAAIAAAYFILK